MEHKNSILVYIIKYVVLCMSGIIALYLGIYSMMRTATFQEMDLPFFIEKDNVICNILFLVIFFGMIMIIVSLLHKIEWLSPRKIIVIECIIMGGLCLLWCYFSQSNPAADQKTVIRIAKILVDSDCYDAEKTAKCIRYIKMFPYQIGIVACYQAIFSVFGLEHTTEEVQMFNVICYVFSLYFMSKITFKVFKNKKVLLYQVLLTFLFLPWLLMMPFCYGDMPSLMFSFGGVYFFLVYENTKKRRYVLLMTAFLIYSCILKPNGIIFVAAFSCVLILKTLQKKEMKWFLLSIVILVVCNLALPTLKIVYNEAYQLEMGEGSPVYGNMLMGLSESFNAGRYTGYVIKVYETYEPDVEAMKQDALSQIQQRIKYLSKNITYTMKFFKEKIATEYCEPTYESLLNNKYYGGEAAFVTDIYYGTFGELINKFLNFYQSGMYILLFIFVISLCKKDMDANSYLFIIYFLGIFLFQIVWEAQCRYILPSIIGILPCVAYACTVIDNKLEKLKSLKRAGRKL